MPWRPRLASIAGETTRREHEMRHERREREAAAAAEAEAEQAVLATETDDSSVDADESLEGDEERP
jgi:hypothetical protein